MTEQEQKRIFSKNLRALLDNTGATQTDLAKAMKVSQQVVNTWCQGIALPRMWMIQSLASHFDVPYSALIDENQASTLKRRGVKIPVLGRVAAGLPIEASEEIIDWEDLPVEMAQHGEYFGLQIRGDSMEPRMKSGDVVIVRKQEDAEDGETVIALVNGDDGVCKHLKKYPDGIALVSNNPAYPPMYFSSGEQESIPVRIVGKVVELRAKF